MLFRSFANVRANFKRPSFRQSFIDNLLGSSGLNSDPHTVDHALNLEGCVCFIELRRIPTSVTENIDADNILLVTPILYGFSLADKRWHKNTCSKSSLRSHALVKVEFNVQGKMLPRSNGTTQYSTISLLTHNVKF